MSNDYKITEDLIRKLADTSNETKKILVKEYPDIFKETPIIPGTQFIIGTNESPVYMFIIYGTDVLFINITTGIVVFTPEIMVRDARIQDGKILVKNKFFKDNNLYYKYLRK